LDASGVLAGLAANRTRYLQLLGSAATLADALGRTGMSEAGVAVDQLRQAFSPLRPVLDKVRQLTRYLGFGDQSGVRPIIRSVFAVATPARLAALFTRLSSALRDRFKTLIDQILAPIRSSITDLQHLIDQFDLQPIIDAVQAVFDSVRNQLLAFSPSALLHDQLAAFASLKQDLLAFDPLAPILSVLNGVRDTVARILDKLHASKLLEAPLAIYHTILDAIQQLNIETLLQPVLDVIDEIARQVDEGLDETVSAFKRLQDALPPPGGGSSVSVSVGVG
jgi:hypothetical protein